MSNRENKPSTPRVPAWLSHRIASLRVMEYRRRQRRVVPSNLYADVVSSKESKSA